MPRLRIGDWEGDTVLKGHKESGLVTLVDRRTGYLKAALLPEVKAGVTADTIIRLLRPLRGAVKTLTLDNGSDLRSTGALVRRSQPARTSVIRTARVSAVPMRIPMA